MNGNTALQNATVKLNIDLVSLIAETSIWADHHKPGYKEVWYPGFRRGKRGEKKGTVIAGEHIDDNTRANYAIKQACGLSSKKQKIEQYTTCHIYPNSCYNANYYTAIPNLVLIPRAVAGLSDFHGEVIAALKYRSYELYGWYPKEEALPVKPKNYPSNWQKPI
jgi:hypothetical protein